MSATKVCQSDVHPTDQCVSSTPKEIQFSCRFYTLNNVDTARMTFQAEIGLFLHWQSDSLSGNIWKPELNTNFYIINADDTKVLDQSEVERVQPTSNSEDITIIQFERFWRIRTVISTEFLLQDFPRDCQKIEVTIVPSAHFTYSLVYKLFVDNDVVVIGFNLLCSDSHTSAAYASAGDTKRHESQFSA